MSRPISYTSAVTFSPSSFNSNSSTLGSSYRLNVNNGCNPSTNNSSYASFSAQTTSYYVVYDFELSNIPSNATINSVSCKVRAKVSSTNTNFTTKTMQLYTNTTAKGNSTSVTSTASTEYNLSVGTWTRNELTNAKLRITLQRSSNSQRRFDFYGASLTVNYSVNGTAYTVTASSTYTGATVSPSSQEVMGGETASVQIYTDDINSIVVKDNTIDVTENLQYVVPTGDFYTFTGIPVTYDSENSFYDSIYTGSASDGLAPNTSTSRFCAYVEQTAYAEAKLTYNFDCSSIPQNAIITSVTCIAAAACYSNGQYFNTRTLQLYNGNTAKGNATTITGNGNTRTDHNINGGTWTRSELDNIKIVVHIQRGNNTTQASFSFWGATLTVNYTVPSEPYYEYTITNINDDHDIVVSESIYIPPEEDPEKTYYSLTISSINATTDPVRGTTRVESGTGQTITITPSDPQMTLILDNGVDVSSQLVAHGGTIPDPTVSTAPNASYGFAYSSSTGYYVSQNKGISKSAAVCKVNFNLPVRCLVTIQFINYAEATYDFGVFGNIDATLTNDYYAAGSGGATITDSNYKLACNTSSYNSSSPQTLTYEIPSGEHFIYIKYSKDDASDSNNDTLQFRITNIEPLETFVDHYTYTLSNINQDHSLIFIFGDVTYYFVTSSINGEGKIYPSGQMVQLPGDSYRLVIVPNDTGDTVSITDNNVDTTSSLVRKEEIIEKNGDYITVVNYVYNISNVQTGHTLSVTISPNVKLLIKNNGSWVQLQKVYIKENNSWEEVDDLENLFDNGTIYIKK